MERYCQNTIIQYNIQSISLSVLSPKRKRIRQVPEDRAEMSYRVIGQWDYLERKKATRWEQRSNIWWAFLYS